MTQLQGQLQGKVVFLTGGARGIGAEVARRLRNKGAKLLLTDVDKAGLDALATPKAWTSPSARIPDGAVAGTARTRRPARRRRSCLAPRLC